MGRYVATVHPGRRPLTTAALVAVTVAGCGGGDADEAADDVVDTGVALSIVPNDTATDAADGVAVTVPANFPAGVPLPDGVELAQADELTGDTTIFDITGWHPDTPVPLAEAYLARLRAAGFEVESRSDATDSLLFVALGDEWFVSAGFYPDPVRNTGTSIGVTVGPAASAPVSD